MTRPIDRRGRRGARRTDDITPLGDPLLERLPSDTRLPDGDDDELDVAPVAPPVAEGPPPLDSDPPASEPVAAPGDAGIAPDTPETEEHTVARRRRRALIDWLIVVGVALLVAFLVRTFVLAHFVVDGVSMQGTLEDDDRVFVNKLSYRFGDPDRGDIVVLHQISGTSERDLIKRVVGLPGERVEFRDCEVLINGNPLNEPYLDEAARQPATCGSNDDDTTVGKDQVYVLGDNRGGSQDSRNLGAIDNDDLVGRAFVVFWPTDHWQWL